MAAGERGRRTAEQARAAVLAAAQAEFAAHGRAGARIDRIARAAGASKERLYAYFADKDALFAEVVEDVLDRITQAVPVDTADLGEYVGDLVSWFHAHPAEVRLAFWVQLDGAPASRGSEQRGHDVLAKVSAVAAAQRAGVVDDTWDPGELLQVLLALAVHWAVSPNGTRVDVEALDAETRARQRAAAVKAARRITTPVPRGVDVRSAR